jgi:hypothetical protein
MRGFCNSLVGTKNCERRDKAAPRCHGYSHSSGQLSVVDATSIHFSAQKTNKTSWYGRTASPDVVLPIFSLTSRFLDNPISSNISRTNSSINKGDNLIDKWRLSSKQTAKSSSHWDVVRMQQIWGSCLVRKKERLTVLWQLGMWNEKR